MVPPDFYSIYQPLKTMVFLNSMHRTRNTHPRKQVMKTCTSIRTMKCTWEQSWTTSSSGAHDYFKRLRYIFCKNQCEQNRTQILTILMLSLENESLPGYMLTGKLSRFLETDGSLAWLYHCPLLHSPLHAMNQCYDQIPIICKGHNQFVDPITRKTHPVANLQNCTDRIRNLLQFDMDQEDSWYTMTYSIVHQERPVLFRSKDVLPVVFHSFSGSQDAGKNT